MSECAAIVTRREDREMGKQGDRKARKQRAQEREQHRRQASAPTDYPASLNLVMASSSRCSADP